MNSGATKECSQAGGYVVTFASDEEFTFVASHVDAGAFWVGLHGNGNLNHYNPSAASEPGWATSCSGCYAHTANPTMALPKGDAGGSGQAICVEAFSDPAKSWVQIPCTGVNPPPYVVCEFEPAGRQSRQCGAAVCIDLVWTYGKKSYVYSAQPTTADEAEQACDQLGPGGRLVVFQSRDEREQLWKQLERVGMPPAIWIGLSQIGPSDGGMPDAADAGDAGDAGTIRPTGWLWDDDAAPDAHPSPWAESEPRTSGAGLTSRAYGWKEGIPVGSDDTLARNDALALDATLPYVCEIAVGDGGM
jgi:hypothetical protein